MKVEGRLYGGDGTIHGTDYVDVEVDPFGNVVSVWFRCQPLKFKQTRVDNNRAADMDGMYGHEQYRMNGVVMNDD